MEGRRCKRRRNPPARAKLTILDGRDLAEVEMHVQPDRSHTATSHSARQTGDVWANDTDGSALPAQPDKSQGRPPKSPGSNAHRPRTGLANAPSTPTLMLVATSAPSSPSPWHTTIAVLTGLTEQRTSRAESATQRLVLSSSPTFGSSGVSDPVWRRGHRLDVPVGLEPGPVSGRA
jgi:hypothetical protein